MNYDAFERDVLGYGAWIGCRAERRRLLRRSAPAQVETGGQPVRFQLAGALRSLADRLDTNAAQPC